ncbi:MAG: leucine-rich repeat domain-containing protein [Treponema sp.]
MSQLTTWQKAPFLQSQESTTTLTPGSYRQDGSGQTFTSDTTVSSNLTVYAKWKPNSSVSEKLEQLDKDGVTETTVVTIKDLISTETSLTQEELKKLAEDIKTSDKNISLDLSGVTVENNAIPSDTFKDCDNITSVTLPDKVTTIGSGAFEGCTGLTEVTIPDTVTSIEDGAFTGCTNVTEVAFEGNAPSMGKDVFGGCDNLDTVVSEPGATGFNDTTFTNSLPTDQSGKPIATVKYRPTITVTLAKTNDATIGLTNTKDTTFTVNTFNSYAWYLDGIKETTTDTTSHTYTTTNLSAGNHTVMVLVNGNRSATATITVTTTANY